MDVVGAAEEEKKKTRGLMGWEAHKDYENGLWGLWKEIKTRSLCSEKCGGWQGLALG